MLNLKRIRLKNEMTLSGLAIKSKIAVGYISDLENGKALNPSLKILQKLSNALDVSLEDLIEKEC